MQYLSTRKIIRAWPTITTFTFLRNGRRRECFHSDERSCCIAYVHQLKKGKAIAHAVSRNSHDDKCFFREIKRVFYNYQRLQYWLANLVQIFTAKRTEIVKTHCSDTKSNKPRRPWSWERVIPSLIVMVSRFILGIGLRKPQLSVWSKQKYWLQPVSVKIKCWLSNTDISFLLRQHQYPCKAVKSIYFFPWVDPMAIG